MTLDRLLPLTKQTFLVILVGTTVVLGTGIGFTTEFSSDQGVVTTPTSTPPTVSVTPMDTQTPTMTEASPDDGDRNTRETPTRTTTVTTTETASENSPADSQSHTVNLRVTATDPDDVANEEGHVAGLRGEVSGTLSWSGEVDAVVLVVSTWSPHNGWVEKRRVTISGSALDSSVILSEALDRTSLLYATGERAAAFDNPEDATRASRRGYVGVTAILFDDAEVARVARVTEYSFDVVNAGTVDVELGHPGGHGTAINVADAAPGTTGNRTITVRNNGTASGTARLFLRNVTGAENGFTDSELQVDGDSESELLGYFGLRLAVVTEEERFYILGGPSDYVILGDYPDAWLGSFSLPSGDVQRIVVEWRVPTAAGNDVMTDSVSFDLQFQFVSDGTE